MRVLFLDIDGVVNTIQIYKEPQSFKTIKNGNYYFSICSPSEGRVSNVQAVVWLDKICKDFNFKIVLSSTWRMHGLEETKKALYASGLSEDIEIIGATKVLGHQRGIEIEDYLDNHPEIEEFIILDDDSDMYNLMDHLVRTDVYGGITAHTEIMIINKMEELYNTKDAGDIYHSNVLKK